MSAPGTSRTHFREGNRLLRASSIVALVLLLPVTLALVMGASLIPFRFHVGRNFTLVFIKMLMPAFVWPLCWLGLLCAFAGLALAFYFWRNRGRIGFASVLGLVVAIANVTVCVMAARYIYRSVAASRVEIAQAFGRDVSRRLVARPSSAILRHRWSPAAFHDPDPRVERNVLFWTVPETNQQLLADIWYPPAATPPSGLAFLFFHGSGWHMSDKGVGMDSTFRHLVAQGHVVMDVAYRLAPDADLVGMVGDAKRAIVWMEANGSRYGAAPDRIVVSGASAGGQIALLAAYSSGEPEFTPAELAGADTSVLGVVSYYGPADMRAFVNHEVGRLITSGVRATRRIPLTDPKTHLPTGPMTLEQMMFNVMGGMPEDVPHAYDLGAVKSHITPKTPPTLLFQGECDSFVQTQAVRDLANALRAAEVPVVYVEFPDTDHGFDIASAFTTLGGVPVPIESQFAPPSQAAVYDLDRFLAVLAAR